MYSCEYEINTYMIVMLSSWHVWWSIGSDVYHKCDLLVSFFFFYLTAHSELSSTDCTRSCTVIFASHFALLFSYLLLFVETIIQVHHKYISSIWNVCICIYSSIQYVWINSQLLTVSSFPLYCDWFPWTF